MCGCNDLIKQHITGDTFEELYAMNSLEVWSYRQHFQELGRRVNATQFLLYLSRHKKRVKL